MRAIIFVLALTSFAMPVDLHMKNGSKIINAVRIDKFAHVWTVHLGDGKTVGIPKADIKEVIDNAYDSNQPSRVVKAQADLPPAGISSFDGVEVERRNLKLLFVSGLSLVAAVDAFADAADLPSTIGLPNTNEIDDQRLRKQIFGAAFTAIGVASAIVALKSQRVKVTAAPNAIALSVNF